MSTTTGTIYLNDSVQVMHDQERDYYSVIAQKDIPSGTLVVLEYPVSAKDEETLLGALIIDREFQEELFPRSTQSPPCLQSKVHSNVFFFPPDLVLGRVMSKFNHSCVPNCHVSMADHYKGHKIYGVWVHRAVKVGQELTVDYVNCGSIEYHDKCKEKYGFDCDCTNDYIIANEKRADIHMNMSSAFCKKNEAFIQLKVDAYFRGNAGGKAVYKAQQEAAKTAKKIVLV